MVTQRLTGAQAGNGARRARRESTRRPPVPAPWGKATEERRGERFVFCQREREREKEVMNEEILQEQQHTIFLLFMPTTATSNGEFKWIFSTLAARYVPGPTISHEVSQKFWINSFNRKLFDVESKGALVVHRPRRFIILSGVQNARLPPLFRAPLEVKSDTVYHTLTCAGWMLH